MRNKLTTGISGICENVSFVHTSVNNALVKSQAIANGTTQISAKPSARRYGAVAGEGAAWISIFLLAESMGTISAHSRAQEQQRLRRPGDLLRGWRRRFELSLFRALRFPNRCPFALASVGFGSSTIELPHQAEEPKFCRGLSFRAGSRAATHILVVPGARSDSPDR